MHGGSDQEIKGARVNTAGSPYLGNYVSLQVQNIQLFALVDSGAEITCIIAQSYCSTRT